MTIQERAKKIVSVSEFSNYIAPPEIVKVQLECPYDEQKILRMAVRVDGGQFYFPEELEWMYQLFVEAFTYQRTEIGVEHSFCYITVRHGVVDSVLDDEWHVDGFSTRITHIPEQNYIWTNSNGTEYVQQGFNFPKDFNPIVHNVHLFMQPKVQEQNIVKCKDEVLYCLDPYILHRRPKDSTGSVRTFVRISFVPIEINDINNTPNPLLKREYNRDGVALRNKLIKY